MQIRIQIIQIPEQLLAKSNPYGLKFYTTFGLLIPDLNPCRTRKESLCAPMFTLFTPFDECRDFLSKPILGVINLDPDTTI